MTPRVSVVIPAYDAAETVGGAISSVLSQTYDDLEVVVVDDGSRDATGAVAAAFEGPVRVVSQPNAGVAAARNRGLAEAQGELIAFCDADDVLLPRHLEALLAIHEPNGGIATSNCYWLFPGGIHPSRTRYKGRFPKPERQRLAILEQNFVSTMSLFPKALADEIGPFDTGLEVAEDWDFWLRAVYAGHTVSLQPEPLALYRWGTSSLSAEPERMDENVAAVLRKAAARARPAGRGARVPRQAPLRPRTGRARPPRRRGAARPPLPRGCEELSRRGRSLPERARAPPEGARHAPGAMADRATRPLAAAEDRAGSRLRGGARPVSARELSVAFVCTGNRFRSPIAEALFVRDTEGLPVQTESLGTLDLGPRPAVPEAVALAETMGLDLSGHLARSLTGADLGAFDLVLGFERRHVLASVVDAHAHIEQTFTLPDFVALLETLPGPPLPNDRVERALIRIRQAHAARPSGFRNEPMEELRDPLGLPAAAQRETVALAAVARLGGFGGTSLVAGTRCSFRGKDAGSVRT